KAGSGFQDRRDRPLCHLSPREWIIRSLDNWINQESTRASVFCPSIQSVHPSIQFRVGRAGGTRTPNRRFWRPLLYQLSYRPIAVEGCCTVNTLTHLASRLFNSIFLLIFQ